MENMVGAGMASMGPSGDGNGGGAAYLHAFVALAASSAVVAGAPGAHTLLKHRALL